MMNAPDLSAEFLSDWPNVSVAKILEYQAIALPEHIAIASLHSSITYKELNQRANGLAQRIQGHAQPEDYVVVITTDFIESIIGQFAILKSGMTVVLLDPSAPLEMLIAALKSTPCSLILSCLNDQTVIEQILYASYANLQVLYSNESVDFAENLSINPKLNKPAYLMFTSGSTGEPKGIIKSHQFVVRDLISRAEKYQMTVDDRVMLTHDLFFTRTLFTALSTIFGGATMVVKNLRQEGIDVIPEWLNENQITIFSPTGSMLRGLNAILKGSAYFSSLRLIRIGAEAVAGSDLDTIKKCLAQHCKIWINYGSTEAGTICCHIFFKDELIKKDILPVGFPLSGKTIQIMDENGKPVPTGTAGEVAVCDEYLASSYFNDDDSLNDKFAIDTDNEGVRRVTYFTGDIGMILPNGALELQGRKDRICKIRGFRVNLSWVEMALRQLSGVAEAAVIVREGPYSKRLIGFVVLEESSSLSSSNIKQMLGDKLSDYMIPSQLTIIDQFPRLSNGKIDFQKLSDYGQDKGTAPRSDLSITPTEGFIKNIWKELLGHSEFGSTDSFFDMGGDSISAAVMITKLEKAFDVEFRSERFWLDPTITGTMKTLQLEQKTYTSDYHELNSTLVLDKDKKVLNEVIEALKEPGGRVQLVQAIKQKNKQKNKAVNSRKTGHRSLSWQKVLSLLSRNENRFWGFAIKHMAYKTTVRLFSFCIKFGMKSLILPKTEKKKVDHFQRSVKPSITKAELNKCYLFHVLGKKNVIKLAIHKSIANGVTNVHMNVVGEHYLESALDQGKGVILVDSHTVASNWIQSLGWDILTLGNTRLVLKHHDLLKYKKVVNASLLTAGAHRLQQGGIVRILADGKNGTGQTYDFLIAGFQCKFYTGFAELALLSDAIVIPVTSFMPDPFRVTIRLEKPLDKGSNSYDHSDRVKSLIHQYTILLEDQVYSFPWQVKLDTLLP